MSLSLKEMQAAEIKGVNLDSKNSHGGYVQMYEEKSLCLACHKAAGMPIPLYGWTPGECDNDPCDTEPPSDLILD